MLRLLPEAEEEIREAAQWYEDRQNGLGEQFLNELQDGLIAIERHPRRFATIQTRTRREIRRCLLNRFPYSIVYEVRSDECVVIAVPHARRRPRYWRKRVM